MQQLLQHNLNHARQLMKLQADKKRRDKTFVAGDSVFIKLQPYVQSSVSRRANHKLSFKYFGPYSITRVINPTAYEVQLPSESRIHPVFHVSQLRRALSPGTPSSSCLPILTDKFAIPVKIISKRWKRTATGRREQVQVQWSNADDQDITWEDKLELQQRFPAAPAWGQAGSQGGGDVRVPMQPDSDGSTNRATARPKRLVQPNRKHISPDWVNYTQESST
jgi:hypothetical protein